MLTNVLLVIVLVMLTINLAGIVSINKKVDSTQKDMAHLATLLESMLDTFSRHDDKFIEILNSILDSDEKFSAGMRETTAQLLNTVRERDKKIMETIQTIADNSTTMRTYIYEFIDSEDARITQIIDYIRDYRKTNQDTLLNSCEDCIYLPGNEACARCELREVETKNDAN